MFGRAEGRRLNELRLAAVEDWLAARIDAGAASAAVPELEAHTTANPLRERGWALLVRCPRGQRQPGGRVGCPRPGSACARRRVGRGPGRGAAHPAGPGPGPGPHVAGPHCRLPASLVPPVTPMVGRTVEMAALEEQWRAAASGPGRRVLLTGEPGSGRWRLAGELAVRVHRQRAAVMLGGSPAPGRGPALRVVDARGGTPEALADPRPGELLLVVAGPDAGVTADSEVRTQPLDVAQVGQPPICRMGARLTSSGRPSRSTPDPVATWRGPGVQVQWAREHVAGRVADRTAASVGTAAAHEQQRAALTDDVLRWSALRPDPSVDRQVCPWRGLASYQETDAAWFAGRERLTAEMVARVGAERALLLVGGSGSGKSSLLRAGLLASLASGALPGSPGWVRVVLRPGEQHRCANSRRRRWPARGQLVRTRVADLLTRSFEGRGAAERLLLVVDQLEECWTVCADAGGARRLPWPRSRTWPPAPPCRSRWSWPCEPPRGSISHPRCVGGRARRSGGVRWSEIGGA